MYPLTRCGVEDEEEGGCEATVTLLDLRLLLAI